MNDGTKFLNLKGKKKDRRKREVVCFFNIWEVISFGSGYGYNIMESCPLKSCGSRGWIHWNDYGQEHHLFDPTQNLCSPARMKLILKIYEKKEKENKCWSLEAICCDYLPWFNGLTRDFNRILYYTNSKT